MDDLSETARKLGFGREFISLVSNEPVKKSTSKPQVPKKKKRKKRKESKVARRNNRR